MIRNEFPTSYPVLVMKSRGEDHVMQPANTPASRTEFPPEIHAIREVLLKAQEAARGHGIRKAYQVFVSLPPTQND
jgi:hypothetical protein